MNSANITIAMPCQKCRGRRYIGGLLCGDCNGNGRVPSSFAGLVDTPLNWRRVGIVGAILVVIALTGLYLLVR